MLSSGCDVRQNVIPMTPRFILPYAAGTCEALLGDQAAISPPGSMKALNQSL